MNRPYIIFAAATVVAVEVFAAGWMIRDGLLTLAATVREKPMPSFPQQLHLTPGDSKLNLSVRAMQVESSKDHRTSVVIDNIRIQTPATRPAK